MNKEMKKELTRISAEIEADAIQMRLDYERNPSDMPTDMPSGSVIEVPSDNSSYSIWCMDMSTILCQTA
jgi:hypothetical protein